MSEVEIDQFLQDSFKKMGVLDARGKYYRFAEDPISFSAILIKVEDGQYILFESDFEDHKDYRYSFSSLEETAKFILQKAKLPSA